MEMITAEKRKGNRLKKRDLWDSSTQARTWESRKEREADMSEGMTNLPQVWERYEWKHPGSSTLQVR